MHYLKLYLKGEAKEAVEKLFLSNTEDSYTSAFAILQERYGNPFLVAEAFRDQIENWPRIGGSDHKGLPEVC